MEPALKEQVLLVSELANHKGWEALRSHIMSQQTYLMNEAFAKGKIMEDKLQALGEVSGMRKILQFVEAMVAQRKDIQP